MLYRKRGQPKKRLSGIFEVKNIQPDISLANPPPNSSILAATRSQTKLTCSSNPLLQSDKQVESIVAQPYILQGNSDSKIQDLDYGNVSISFPLNKVKNLVPSLIETLSQLEKTPSILHSFTDPFNNASSRYIQIEVFSMKVRAILDSGAPLVILSSKFVKKIPFQPDVSYDKIFGTAVILKYKL